VSELQQIKRKTNNKSYKLCQGCWIVILWWASIM